MPTNSARRLRIPNPDLSHSQRTYFDADYTSGNPVTVVNTDAFAANQIAVAGEPGHEKAESGPILNISGTTGINIAGGFSFAHNKGDILYRSEYDQIEISTNVGAGWVVLVTTQIQWDQRETMYVDNGGTDVSSYRFRFKNSATLNYSEYSPTISGSGYSKFSVGRMVQNVRRIIRDPEKKIVSDIEIIRFLTDAKDTVRGIRNDWWFWKRESEGDITTVANVFTYNLDDIATTIDYIAEIRYRYNNGSVDDTYPIDDDIDLVFDAKIRNGNRLPDDYVQVFNIQPPDANSTSGYIRVFPTPKTTGYGSFYVRWYEAEDDFSSVADTTSIPLPSILENWAIAQCERIKGNDAKADVYENLFYGPPDVARDKRRLGGIALLEIMQGGKGRSIKRPRQLKVFKGRNFHSRVYQRTFTSNDDRREQYY